MSSSFQDFVERIQKIQDSYGSLSIYLINTNNGKCYSFSPRELKSGSFPRLSLKKAKLYLISVRSLLPYGLYPWIQIIVKSRLGEPKTQYLKIRKKGKGRPLRLEEVGAVRNHSINLYVYYFLFVYNLKYHPVVWYLQMTKTLLKNYVKMIQARRKKLKLCFTTLKGKYFKSFDFSC